MGTGSKQSRQCIKGSRSSPDWEVESGPDPLNCKVKEKHGLLGLKIPIRISESRVEAAAASHVRVTHAAQVFQARVESFFLTDRIADCKILAAQDFSHKG